ncbi:hypothetical protein ACWOFR_11485 [Carnobacterium gallinarum]|uniref:hypothetical protein n=1 Tax=Carnobacterium gallinarum TaxID=2749 RepID=UPI00055661D5|nr:hypothetical protein [Carnobacterium gallinarum]
MKNTTKGLLIGLGATVVVGTIIVSSSEKAVKKIESYMNRKRAKDFIKDKLNGNNDALDVVDHLSDDEITNLLQIVDKVNTLKGRINVYGDNLKDAADEFKDTIHGYKETVKEKFDR